MGVTVERAADAALVERATAAVRDRIWAECDPAAILREGPAEAARIVAALAVGFIAEDPDVRGVEPEVVRCIVDGVVAATMGLGPIESLLADPRVAEVMVNGHDEVYVERDGRIERVAERFDDDAHLLRVIDRILAPVGRRVDAMSPMVDARLADGSRINVVVAPLAVDGPILTIRRFVRIASDLDDLVGLGTLDADSAAALTQLVEERANVLVSGGTSTGKTTLLAAVLAAGARRDRVVLIEDSAELPLDLPHRVRLEARPAAYEGASAIGIRDLVRNALRMRPDRIVVGEVRGAEAFDLLQALNTGHRGSWSTVHANGVQDALHRLESMAMCADTGVPHEVVRHQVARAIDAVVQLERRGDGRRVVSCIADVRPLDGGRAWEVVGRTRA